MFENMFEKALKIEKGWYFGQTNLGPTCVDLIFNAPNVANIARAVFVSLFLLQKQLIYDFLAGNNCSNSPHSQRVWNLAHKFHLYLIL